MVVEMLLRLFTVSPQPPSAFWCAASQDRPAAMRGPNEPWAAVAFRTRERALTAVAVDRAEVESSPTQWPSGVRSARRAARAVR
jgi:hypothetical protein